MIVEDFELVEMSVSEELSSNGGFVSVDNRVVIPGPHFQAVGMTGRNVTLEKPN